jgi:hypothetical protein
MKIIILAALLNVVFAQVFPIDIKDDPFNKKETFGGLNLLPSMKVRIS